MFKKLSHSVLLTSFLSSFLSSSSSTSTADNSTSSLKSATRKFFFADNPENVDEDYDGYSPAPYHSSDDSLPFGNFGISDSKPISKTKITIQQFINKLKEIQKKKQLKQQSRTAPSIKTGETKYKRVPNTPKSLVKPNTKNQRKKENPSFKTSPKSQVQKKGFPSKSQQSKNGSDVKLKKPTDPIRKNPSILPDKTLDKKQTSKSDKPKSEDKQIKQKQPKFTLPKLEKPRQKETIIDTEEDDFFRQGAAEAHGNHHVHQHDHLHAHKAFHKHKSKHDHKHAHSNDHVHNHKHTHNHVHNHIHKHNEQHEHNAEHTHTEKHHHKHLEYIDAGGWKKRNDPNSDDNIYARSDADADKEPIFEPFDDKSEQKVGIQERSGHVAVGNDVKNNVKDYLQQYIEFYKSVADADVDIADERNDYGGDHMSVTNKKNTFHDKTFMLDDNDFNQQTTEDFYQPEVEQYNTKILPNYEKHQEDVADLSFDDYMTALSDQFPYIADHDEILNDDYDVEDAGSFLSYKMTAAHDNVPNDDVHERAAAWEPVLQDIQIAFYDLEPDWAPQYDVSLERKFDTDEKNDSNE